MTEDVATKEDPSFSLAVFFGREERIPLLVPEVMSFGNSFYSQAWTRLLDAECLSSFSLEIP